MKIGILTQPLHNNYGGLLQAFALQKILKRQGHDVITVDLYQVDSRYQYLRNICARSIKKYILKRNIDSVLPFYSSLKEKKIISTHTQSFIKRNITLTTPIPLSRIKELNFMQFEAFIVGSDQVWRPRYSPNIASFFLDFVPQKTNIKRIAYAASFGVDDWEFSNRLTRKCRKLIRRFDAVSVREDSAVELVRKHLEKNATHLLDPTMLLESQDYLELVKISKDSLSSKELMVYVLDENEEKTSIIQKISSSLQLSPLRVMPELTLNKRNRKFINKCIYPPVENWLKGFIESEFVITDSFHGTVFSIIFNKPFLTIANTNRGLTRFTSLLKLFNLENRLIFSKDGISDELLKTRIDFASVNEKLKEQQKKAHNFLKILED